MREYVLKKKVYLKFDKGYVADNDMVEAYVYLKNKIFVNAYLIKSGFAVVDRNSDFDLKDRFTKLEDIYPHIMEIERMEREETKVTQ